MEALIRGVMALEALASCEIEGIVLTPLDRKAFIMHALAGGQITMEQARQCVEQEEAQRNPRR